MCRRSRSCWAWLFDARHQELLLLRDFVVVAVDHHVYEVPQPDHDSVVALELLLHAVELKVILHVVAQGHRRLEVPWLFDVDQVLFFIILLF